MTKKERVEEALRGFQHIWNLRYPEKGEGRKIGVYIDVNQLQEAWNAYMRANIEYHGKYVPRTDPSFLS